MSWIEKVKTGLKITTGDGKEYFPNWMNSVRSREFNVSQFVFPDVNGTLVKKKRPRGMVYELDMYFQGDDHLDTAEAFDLSTFDETPWTIEHPLYGSIIVQLISPISYDNARANTTNLKFTVAETILDDSPQAVLSPEDQVVVDKEALDQTNLDALDSDTNFTGTDKTILNNNCEQCYELGKKAITDPDEFDEYRNLFNQATNDINNATAEPLQAMTSLQSLLNYPAQFSISAQQRIELLTNQFEALVFTQLTTEQHKKIFEQNATAIIGSMAVAAVTPQPGNYISRSQVFQTITVIINIYNTFITNLDALQSANNSSPDSYIPDHTTADALNALINLTVTNLFYIAIGTRQERYIYLDEDSNIITLTHRFYGTGNDDVNIQFFMDTNEIGLNEMLIIPKGRKIVFYA